MQPELTNQAACMGLTQCLLECVLTQASSSQASKPEQPTKSSCRASPQVFEQVPHVTCALQLPPHHLNHDLQRAVRAVIQEVIFLEVTSKGWAMKRAKTGKEPAPARMRTRIAPWPLVSIIRGEGTPA